MTPDLARRLVSGGLLRRPTSLHWAVLIVVATLALVAAASAPVEAEREEAPPLPVGAPCRPPLDSPDLPDPCEIPDRPNPPRTGDDISICPLCPTPTPPGRREFANTIRGCAGFQPIVRPSDNPGPVCSPTPTLPSIIPPTPCPTAPAKGPTQGPPRCATNPPNTPPSAPPNSSL